MSGIDRRALERGGTRLSYLGPSGRTGAPLILLHGLSGDSSSWNPVFERFGSTWRTYALDFRGHGGSSRTPGAYALDDYLADVDALLGEAGEPAVLVGHSLGGVAAAALAQGGHPLVRAVVLEDPPIYVVDPEAFAGTSFARVFPMLRDAVTRFQADGAPLDVYKVALAASPHPAGDTMGDHTFDDALSSRAGALSVVDPAAITAVVDGTTFASFDPDRAIACPGIVLRANPACDAAFLPEHQDRLWRLSPHIAVVEVPGAAHNIRGDLAGRAVYLDALAEFLDGLERVGGPAG